MFDLVEVTTNLAAQVKRSLYTDDVSLSASSTCLPAWADVEHLWIDATNQSHSSRRQQILVSKPFLSPKKKKLKLPQYKINIWMFTEPTGSFSFSSV